MYASPLAALGFVPFRFPGGLPLSTSVITPLNGRGPATKQTLSLWRHTWRDFLRPYGASSSFRFLPTPYDTALFLRWSAALVLSLLVIRACDMAPSPTPQFKGACQSCGAASE